MPEPMWAERSDAELLERFATHREEGAFAALAERHGRMVRGVCVRVLGDLALAEDACQVAFLVLACQAEKVRRRLTREASLGPWLHRVARNAAIQAKRSESARKRRETVAARRRQQVEPADSAWGDVLPMLDDEIQRLPERYRTPLILCYLEDQSQHEAATRLGLAYGTLRRRLERARELLHIRLVRRGVVISLVWLVDFLGHVGKTALATPPPTFAATGARTWLSARDRGLSTRAARADLSTGVRHLLGEMRREATRRLVAAGAAAACGGTAAILIALWIFWSGHTPPPTTAGPTQPLVAPAPAIPVAAVTPTAVTPTAPQESVAPPAPPVESPVEQFSGQIVINGRTVTFNNAAEFERARQELRSESFTGPHVLAPLNRSGTPGMRRPYDGPEDVMSPLHGFSATASSAITIELGKVCCCKRSGQSRITQSSRPAACRCDPCPAFPDSRPRDLKAAQ